MLSEIKNKKGVSVLVGYVLLIAFIIILSAVTYTWLRTYVPAENLECPTGISIFTKEVAFNDLTNELDITLQNTGRFDVAGYFIYAKNDSSQEIARIDLSPYHSQGGFLVSNSILFSQSGSNSFSPGEEKTHIFILDDSIGEPYSIQITPVRYEEIGGRNRFVSCDISGSQQLVGAGSGSCVPDCSGKVCGSDGCGGSCLPGCTSPEICDPTGQCYNPSCSPASNPCGSQQCGTAVNGTCGNVYCGSFGGGCQSGYTCNATNQCELICGNSVLDTGEECDSGENCQVDCQCPSGQIPDGSLGCTTTGNGQCDAGETCSSEPACEGEQAQCSTGQICQSGSCEWQEGGVYTENEYCIDIGQEQGLNYISGDCTNPGFCSNNGGTNEDDEPGAEIYCPGTPQPILCCFA